MRLLHSFPPYDVLYTTVAPALIGIACNFYSSIRHSTGFPSSLSVFFVSSVCLLVRVTMVDKNKAVVCCLLATSAIILSENKKSKRKMWSKKWYLKRNISCDAHLLNELLKTGVPWDDANVVSASKLKKMWDSLSELRISLLEGRLERTVLRSAIACQNCAVYSVFPSGMTSHSKISPLNWECIGRLRHPTSIAVFDNATNIALE